MGKSNVIGLKIFRGAVRANPDTHGEWRKSDHHAMRQVRGPDATDGIDSNRHASKWTLAMTGKELFQQNQLYRTRLLPCYTREIDAGGIGAAIPEFLLAIFMAQGSGTLRHGVLPPYWTPA